METKNKADAAKELLGDLRVRPAQKTDQAEPAPTEGAPTDQPDSMAQEITEQAAAATQPVPADPGGAPMGDVTQPPEQTREQIGKDPLPAEETPEGDFEEVEFEQEEDQQPDAEPEPVFTDEDRKDLPILEEHVETAGIKQAKALREIRRRKLWMLHRQDDGSRKYKTFDDYCDDRGFSRQTVTHQTTWLAWMETLAELRAKGEDVPKYLSAHAVAGLWQLDAAGGFQGTTTEEQKEQGLVAVVKEAREEGLSFSHVNLRAICQRRARFYARQHDNQRTSFAAASYEAFKNDLRTLDPLTGVQRNRGVWGLAERLAADGSILFEEALVQICKDKLALPEDEYLLSYGTGADLEAMVQLLIPVAQAITVLVEKDKAINDAKRDLNRIQATRRQLAEGLGIKSTKKNSKPTDDGAEDEQNELSSRNDPRTNWEAENSSLGSTDLAAKAAVCLAAAWEREIGDPSATLAHATSAKAWAEKLIERCQEQVAQLEPLPVESLHETRME